MFKLNNIIVLQLIFLNIIDHNLTHCAAKIQTTKESTKQDLELIKAAKNGNKKKVKELLEQGVNAANKHGYTALMQAVIGGYKEISKMLLNAGADVDAVNSNGDTTLILAAGDTRGNEIIEFLLNEKANVNAVNSLGDTALMWAAENGNKEAVKLLLNNGADVNAVDNNGQTALIRGIRSYGIDDLTNQRKEIVGLLLRAGANVGHIDNAGKGAIDLIRETDEYWLTKIIIENPGLEARHELVKILEDEPSRREAVLKKWKEDLAKKINESTSGKLIPDITNIIAEYAGDYNDLPLEYRLNN